MNVIPRGTRPTVRYEHLLESNGRFHLTYQAQAQGIVERRLLGLTEFLFHSCMTLVQQANYKRLDRQELRGRFNVCWFNKVFLYFRTCYITVGCLREVSFFY